MLRSSATADRLRDLQNAEIETLNVSNKFNMLRSAFKDQSEKLRTQSGELEGLHGKAADARYLLSTYSMKVDSLTEQLAYSTQAYDSLRERYDKDKAALLEHSKASLQTIANLERALEEKGAAEDALRAEADRQAAEAGRLQARSTELRDSLAELRADHDATLRALDDLHAELLTSRKGQEAEIRRLRHELASASNMLETHANTRALDLQNAFARREADLRRELEDLATLNRNLQEENETHLLANNDLVVQITDKVDAYEAQLEALRRDAAAQAAARDAQLQAAEQENVFLRRDICAFCRADPAALGLDVLDKSAAFAVQAQAPRQLAPGHLALNGGRPYLACFADALSSDALRGLVDEKLAPVREAAAGFCGTLAGAARGLQAAAAQQEAALAEVQQRVDALEDQAAQLRELSRAELGPGVVKSTMAQMHEQLREYEAEGADAARTLDAERARAHGLLQRCNALENQLALAAEARAEPDAAAQAEIARLQESGVEHKNEALRLRKLRVELLQENGQLKIQLRDALAAREQDAARPAEAAHLQRQMAILRDDVELYRRHYTDAQTEADALRGAQLRLELENAALRSRLQAAGDPAK